MSTTEAAAGNTTNGGQSLCWSYDSFGNGTAQSSQSGACPILPSLPPATAIDNANNQVTWTSVHGAALGLGYDAAGNVINDNLNSYLYDADGTRVAKGTITSISCDPAVNGFQTTTDYVLGLAGEQVTEVGVNANGMLSHQHTNVWAGGKLLGTYDNDGLHFYLDDPLGTRRLQTDYLGAIEQQCVSFPFGDGESCTSTPTEHLFTGKERDAESGLDYFEAPNNGPAPCSVAGRAQMLGNGLLNLALAAGKFGAAAGVEAGTSGIGTALALYGVYSGAGNLTTGLIQVVGAFSSNPSGFQQAATVSSVAGSLAGITTLVATHGNLGAASNASKWENLGLFGLKGGLGSSFNPVSATGTAVNGAKLAGAHIGC